MPLRTLTILNKPFAEEAKLLPRQSSRRRKYIRTCAQRHFPRAIISSINIAIGIIIINSSSIIIIIVIIIVMMMIIISSSNVIISIASSMSGYY